MKTRPVEAEFFHADGRAGGESERTKLTAASRYHTTMF